MKQILIFVIFSIVSLSSFSQTNREDVIYLKNGSIYRGTIIEQIPGESYKIEIYGGSIIVVNANEVQKIAKEELKEEQKKQKEKSSTSSSSTFDYESVTNKGYVGLVEGGFFPILNGYDAVGGSLFYISNWKLSRKSALGFGTGAEFIDDGFFVPIFFDFRLTPSKNKFTPEFAFDLGYSILFDGDVENGGVFMQTTAGGKIYTGTKTALHFGVGPKAQIGAEYGSYVGVTFNIGYSF